ncbi:MAG TPA: hypothetical protein VGD50_05265 [Candidatus Baltobacteraceae bacterium]
MSGFKDHFLDKYFGYRSRYVAHVAAYAPAQAHFAVVSEVARLSFSLAGCLLCALIFWVLTANAAARGGSAPLVVTFGCCAAGSSWFAVLTLIGLGRAIGALRVQK